MVTKQKESIKRSPGKPKGPKETKASPSPKKRGWEEEGFITVGIGASAGGLEAFEQFFTHMPANSGIAFVLVSHLDPKHVSIMPELIQRYTTMRVTTIEDGTTIQPNTVYIIPPNKDTAVLNGTLHLMTRKATIGQRLPIDYFFQSLADDQKERGVGIILSGTGMDGTQGIRAIKAEMGMVMAQDPKTAKYDGMPNSAIDTSLVDYILPSEKMPDQLIAYMNRVSPKMAKRVVPHIEEGKHPDALAKIFLLLRTHTGHDFSLYKHNTIIRRIERRMNVHSIDNLSMYVRYLEENPLEIKNLFKELLIGVTNFFRDPEAFAVLKKEMLQLLNDKPNDYAVRVWDPGCSNGEEAYSIAIIIWECMEELNKHFQVQIFGTDIDTDAIDTARSGIYPSTIASDVGLDRLAKFFVPADGTYQVKREIRETAIFALQSVIKDPPFTKLDLICCRNLLIYLNSELQKKLLPLFHYSLKPGGLLFLGPSETTGGFLDLFSDADKKAKVFKRKESASATAAFIDFPVVPAIGKEIEVHALKSQQSGIAQLAPKTLLEYCAPPSVIINEKGDILYIHGRTGKYLEPAPGEARWNIFYMARGGLSLELPTIIRKAITTKKDVTHEGVQVKGNGVFHFVDVTVKPVNEPESMQGSLVVIFEEVITRAEKERATKKRSSAKKTDQKVEGLERELRYTKESFHTTVEELETSNEELKSTTEELQSTNEELQSTNEELEISKEELQSLNEELVTVNAELMDKIDDLTKANDDLHNLFENTTIGMLFLDNKLRIKRFTSPAAKVINLLPGDIGRPLTHIVSNLSYKRLIEDSQDVLKTLVYTEKEVQTTDGHWYLMRIVPYRTTSNVIAGLVLLFVDIQEQKEIAEELKKVQAEKLKVEAAHESWKSAEDIVNTVREPLIVLDKDLHVISANRSFYQTFRVKKEETKGQLIYELGNRQWDIPQLRELLGTIIEESNVFDDFAVEHDFPEIGHRKMLLNARRIYHEGIGMELILLALSDVTEKETGEVPSTQRQ
jgi:two-component system CheB/CheR fusion protein